MANNVVFSSNYLHQTDMGNCATMVDVSARGELETWGDGEGNRSHVEACVFMGEK